MSDSEMENLLTTCESRIASRRLPDFIREKCGCFVRLRWRISGKKSNISLLVEQALERMLEQEQFSVG